MMRCARRAREASGGSYDTRRKNRGRGKLHPWFRQWRFLAGLFPIMRGADVQQHIVEGEYVATVFHLRTPNGVTMVFDKFRVVDGKLKKINPYYDPSVLNAIA